jgi:TM2 domain-containing membrane protein YozV
MKSKMKSKKTAALLAFFGGVVGAHRFYLGQTFKGLLCIPMGIILGPLFAIYWILSSDEAFDEKYNKQRIQREIIEAIKNK